MAAIERHRAVLYDREQPAIDHMRTLNSAWHCHNETRSRMQRRPSAKVDTCVVPQASARLCVNSPPFVDSAAQLQTVCAHLVPNSEHQKERCGKGPDVSTGHRGVAIDEAR